MRWNPYLAAVIVGALLIACEMPGRRGAVEEPAIPTTPGAVGERGEAINLSVAQLAQNLSDYRNAEVITNGVVAEVLDARAFTFETDGTVGSHRIFVVNVMDDPGETLALGDLVEVHGTVRRMSADEIRRDYGIDLTKDVFLDWTDRDVLLAEDIRKL